METLKNESNTGDETVTISISTIGGGVQQAIESKGMSYEKITNLIITAGTLNANDCQFIHQSLTGLSTLEVGGTADFEHSAIPANAFKGNKAIQYLKLVHTRKIEESAFEDSNLVTAELPALTALGGRVFFNCYTLLSASLPKLTSMENRAFYRCTSLTSLILGENPPELIGSYWFKEILSLKIFVPLKESIQKYKDIYEFSDFRIKLIGDHSVDTEDENQNKLYYDYKYDTNLTSDYTGPYYTGDIKVGLNFYSFNMNLSAWLNNKTNGAPPMDTLQVIRWAKEAVFGAVDVTSYYIPGYHNQTMPTKPHDEIVKYARKVKALCEELDIPISGTGVGNNFADPRDEKRALDVERSKYWIDIAAVMGAPVMRLFSGNVPRDIMNSDWDTIARDRIAPALRECAVYAAAKGVKIGLQNHGDMTATAGQTIQILNWVDHPNIGIVNDTGYFRKFRGLNGLGYDWYADIRAVLPYTSNFQLKTKPAGQETDVPVDLNTIFTDIRNSNYRGFVPIELLWRPGDPGHPDSLQEPPYEQVKQFLDKVKAAIKYTKTKQPSVSG